ncbi:16S rRNA (guanine(966)-N(2))-methyltransferase RsmD [Lyngbya confervoides]|uniref:16S rRNA (Guanine(966)-N(2))-methyltransferase RsmD n=1 Tax=Lyngbya confervoides BDU141951 TaxID=1574623 RepID=A0ABD4T9C8_9CYAN|nr:16S rRNA (guanine(966)-N(2))-methyltransferase RsmD [Lyngbya confervoides]MCM1985054.1 16S rRNA (guanine(966)-N(2))-methyltransferase RsmD [Lyngbya confervoides BDU141951]
MTLRIYGKRTIQTLPGSLTRPTAAKVRESIFNIWAERIPNCRWLDLCSGSGAMGAEALMRGAREVTGIERYAPACKIIRENWQRVSRSDQKFVVLRGDVCKMLLKLQPAYDLIYFDPPYQSQLYEPVLEILGERRLLNAAGAIASEHDRQIQLPDRIGALQVFQQRTYGNTRLTFYRYGVAADSR